MVEATSAGLQKISAELSSSAGPMSMIFSFLDLKERINMQ